MAINVRLATSTDAFQIASLYWRVYKGGYSDPLMNNPKALADFLESDHGCWIVCEEDGAIVGSAVYKLDREQKIAKVFGGAVLPEYRGHSLLEKAMIFGQEYLRNQNNAFDLIYATTRTLTAAPQVITHHLGYKKLGICPNVHRTHRYETHCLTAVFFNGALKKMRFTDYKLHPSLTRLYEIARSECALPPLEVESIDRIKNINTVACTGCMEMEVIDAPKFVSHRYGELKKDGQLRDSFFPFHEANLLLTSPSQDLEVFIAYSKADGYCPIVGIKRSRDINYTTLLNKISEIMRNYSARYIEVIIRADNLARIDQTLDAKFVPSGFFPAFQLYNGKRYDFVVFSRSFEILDFSDLQLEGTFKDYLLQYYDNWRKLALNPKLMEEARPQ